MYSERVVGMRKTVKNDYRSHSLVCFHLSDG